MHDDLCVGSKSCARVLWTQTCMHSLDNMALKKKKTSYIFGFITQSRLLLIKIQIDIKVHKKPFYIIYWGLFSHSEASSSFLDERGWVNGTAMSRGLQITALSKLWVQHDFNVNSRVELNLKSLLLDNYSEPGCYCQEWMLSFIGLENRLQPPLNVSFSMEDPPTWCHVPPFLWKLFFCSHLHTF